MNSTFDMILNVSGIEIYSGYVDDPRNTDNAWMETVAFNFHQDDLHGVLYSMQLHAGDDAKAVKWQDMSNTLNLYASHEDMIEKVAHRHQAHWWGKSLHVDLAFWPKALLYYWFHW